jgi:Mg2+/Co2+ transporter CorB
LDTIPIGVLVAALVLLLLLSAFFSSAEISVMSINRYRLRHLADSGHGGAKILSKLLERPDRLLGIILLGNNLVNNLAAAVTTVLTLKLFDESAIAMATLLLTIIVLIFAEVGPKTVAALRPEAIGFPASYVLKPLLFILYPVVALVNSVANISLRLFGISLDKRIHRLGREELKAAVNEAAGLIPESHQAMLLSILDLEKTVVEDVMLPRGQIVGIDLDDDWDDIVEQITSSRYTRLPVYRGNLDNVVGMLHLRKALNLIGANKMDRESLDKIIVEPYFIPKGTPLNTQLLNFQAMRRRRGLVVDEYGDILGLVTLEEILEEIVGEFTGNTSQTGEDVYPQQDGSFLVKGGAALRDLNRNMNWKLPIKEARTLNGLITEFLEDLPQPGTSLMLDGYTVEIVRTRGTAVEVARVRAPAGYAGEQATEQKPEEEAD